jgi:hypothetical protein
MLNASIDLVPLPDMLGQPIAPWISQFLMALTLALHWVFIAITLCGSIFYFSSRKDHSDEMINVQQRLASFLPFSLSMAMTLGIAPLLFVQVLYGNFFYSSTIMFGWVWLGLLPLTAANLYLLFLGRYQNKKGKSCHLIAIIVLLFMAASAVILSSNSTLLQNPQDWESFRSLAANKPYLADATLWPRLMLAAFALFAGGNLFIALYLRFKLDMSDNGARKKITSKLKLTVIGIIGVLLACIWVSQSLNANVKSIILNSWESVFVYVSIVSLILALLLSILSLGGKMIFLLLGSVSFFMALLCLAFTRDTLRRAALSDYFNLYEISVKAQWSSLVLFLIVFVLGLLLVAYMVNLAITSRQKPLET